MIYINDEKFDWTKKPVTWIEKLIQKSYKELTAKYRLDKGGYIPVTFRKTVGREIKRYRNRDSQRPSGTIMKYPASIRVSRKATITNEDGETSIIVLANSRTNINGNYRYSPTKSIQMNRPMQLSKADRELIVFLYVFSNIVRTRPDEDYVLRPRSKSMFIFADKSKAIANERAAIREKAKLIDIVEEMTEEQLTVFGRRLGIAVNANQDRSIAESNILIKLEQVPEYKEDIKKFVEMYNKDFFESIDIVKEALEKGIITMKEKKTRNTVNAEFYVDGEEKPFFKTLLKSKREIDDDLTVFLSKNQKQLAIIQNKL